MSFCRLPSSLTSIYRGITHLCVSTTHKVHSRALICVFPITITRNIFAKHADERFVTCEKAKVMQFHTCQTGAENAEPVARTPAGGSTVNPVLNTQSQHGYDQGNRRSNNRNRPR